MYKLETYLKIYLQIKLKWKIESFGRLYVPKQLLYQGRLSTVGVCMIISICRGTRGLPPFCTCPWAERGQFFSVRPGFTQRVLTTPGEQS